MARKMKVTTRKWDQPRWVPHLWNVMVDGQFIGYGMKTFSMGRVLKGVRPGQYLAILDGVPLSGSFSTRSAAAQHVADYAEVSGLTTADGRAIIVR